MEERLALSGGETVLLVGPAKAKVLEAETEVFGRRLLQGDEVVAKKYRAIPLESSSKGSILKVTWGHGGGAEKRKRIGCSLWSEAVEELVKKESCSIIVGKADSGKSSLTVYLLNKFLDEGRRPGVVDTDLGQGDIGGPGLIGAAIPKEHIVSLEEVEPFKTRFIGKTSPYGVEGRLEEAVSDLHDLLVGQGCKAILIALHGWISGIKAAQHILRLIERLDIDDVVLLQQGEELEELVQTLKMHEGYRDRAVNLIFLEQPNTYKRSLLQRRKIRERKTRSYFEENAFSVRSIVHGEVPIQGTLMFQGKEVEVENHIVQEVVKGRIGRGVKIVYCESHNKIRKILIIHPKRKNPLAYERFAFGDQLIDVYTSGKEMGLISGFEDEEGDWRIGKLLSVRPLNMEWVFLVPRNLNEITSIILGRMVVNEVNFEKKAHPKHFFA